MESWIENDKKWIINYKELEASNQKNGSDNSV